VKVLGVDASFARTGFAILTLPTDPWVPGTETAIVGALATTKRPGQNDDAVRIDAIAKAAVRWAQDHQVDLVCIEQPWCGRNYSIGMRLQALVATVADRCRQAGYEVLTVYPAEASAAMGVSSKLKRPQRKAAMQRALLTRYGIASDRDDEADAVGVALGGYIKRRDLQRQAEREAERPRLPGLEGYKPRKRGKKRAKGVRR
jgi:Holliday junction resolvasome RuvABC endonuclease subunit